MFIRYGFALVAVWALSTRTRSRDRAAKTVMMILCAAINSGRFPQAHRNLA